MKKNGKVAARTSAFSALAERVKMRSRMCVSVNGGAVVGLKGCRPKKRRCKRTAAVKFPKLARIVSEAYGCDGIVMDYFKNPNGNHGDGLARFIAQEYTETCDGEESYGCVLAAMRKASEQLQRVANAIDNVA